jgi:catechol 2,3-dioxygenase-like lactoylglutathione lyase family enzyme
MEAVHHGSARQGRAIDHLWFRVADVAVSKRFYELVAKHASFRQRHDSRYRAQFAGESGSFSVVFGTPTEHFHMAFAVQDNAAVEAFHREATEAGYTDNGPPGERPMYHPGYYGAYILDPDGNNVELVNHSRE